MNTRDSKSTIATETPNRFLTFFNRQGDLPAGKYTLVVGTNNPAGQSGTFSVSIKRNDGSNEEIINGEWTSSGGLDPDPTCATGNQCFSFDIEDATGASFQLNTALDGVLYLVDDSQITSKIVANGLATGAGTEVSMKFAESEIDETSYAKAYYKAVDPMKLRRTAQDYIDLHGLDKPDVHVIFRDSKDLGYGRDMYMVSYPNPDAVCGGQIMAFFVRNFSVQIVEGFAYGPVNLEAAIAEDLDHHIGTNAIEFGKGRSDMGEPCSDEPMTKFYTFEPDYSSPNAPHKLRLRVDLDARGAKAMPQPCISCHGGKLRPLDRFGRFVAMHANDDITQFGDTKARLQAFEVDTFEFSDEPGHSQDDYEDGLRKLNAAVYCTYPGSAGHPACDKHGGGVAAQADIGEWSGDFGREMLLGWYGDDGVNNRLDKKGAKYDEKFVPTGWTPKVGGAPVGADALFRKVVGPNCFVCHGKRGNELGSDNNASGEGKDLDFSDWEKFISHADEIERLVYDEGKMPMGLLNFQNFWNDPEKAELLASFIAPYVSNPADFEDRRVDASGDIIPPGRIVPRAGPDRITQANAPITLNAQASLFADSYAWEVVSAPGGANVTLNRNNKMKIQFVADTDGDYKVRLTASREDGSSAKDTLNIKVDSGLAVAPRDLNFVDHITPVFGAGGANCISCHADGAQAGVPVWWVDDAMQPAGAGSTGIPASTADNPALGFYEQVMARVNLEVIEDSLLLKKPSNVHHYGGLQPNFDDSLDVGAGGRSNYDMIVNWIAEGALLVVEPQRLCRASVSAEKSPGGGLSRQYTDKAVSIPSRGWALLQCSMCCWISVSMSAHLLFSLHTSIQSQADGSPTKHKSLRQDNLSILVIRRSAGNSKQRFSTDD